MPDPSQQDLETAQSLLALFDQQDEDGTYRFSDGDVRHFLPLVLLQLGEALPDGGLDPEAQELLGLLALAAGVDESTPADDVAVKVTAFYERNPPNPTLVEAFQRFVRERVAGASGGDVSKAVRELLGQQAGGRPLQSEGPRPTGSVGGGLLARLGASKALDEKKKAGDDEG